MEVFIAVIVLVVVAMGALVILLARKCSELDNHVARLEYQKQSLLDRFNVIDGERRMRSRTLLAIDAERKELLVENERLRQHLHAIKLVCANNDIPDPREPCDPANCEDCSNSKPEDEECEVC